MAIASLLISVAMGLPIVLIVQMNRVVQDVEIMRLSVMEDDVFQYPGCAMVGEIVVMAQTREDVLLGNAKPTSSRAIMGNAYPLIKSATDNMTVRISVMK